MTKWRKWWSPRGQHRLHQKSQSWIISKENRGWCAWAKKERWRSIFIIEEHWRSSLDCNPFQLTLYLCTVSQWLQYDTQIGHIFFCMLAMRKYINPSLVWQCQKIPKSYLPLSRSDMGSYIFIPWSWTYY